MFTERHAANSEITNWLSEVCGSNKELWNDTKERAREIHNTHRHERISKSTVTINQHARN